MAVKVYLGRRDRWAFSGRVRPAGQVGRSPMQLPSRGLSDQAPSKAPMAELELGAGASFQTPGQLMHLPVYSALCMPM